MARQSTLVGQPVLMVIDIQKPAFTDMKAGIPVMPGYRENMERARRVIDADHDAGIPVILFQEIHRHDMVDHGRAPEGSEDIHCMDGEPCTPVAKDKMDMRASDHFLQKRRYSCLFGTETEILLNGLKAETLIMIGGITDVCAHYTFVDGHQHDYDCRVVADSVGGTSPEAHQASLNAMEYLQANAVMTTAASVAAIRDWGAARDAA